MKNELYDLESVYDNEISPLVKKIIDICDKNKIPMIYSFAYENSKESGYRRCTTALNGYENRYVEDFFEAYKTITGQPTFHAFGLKISK